jgi:hypothetical protein
MRVKRNPQEPYRRVNGWDFNVVNDIGGWYGLLVVNKADRPRPEIEGHMKDLFQKFNTSAGELKVRLSNASS